MASTSDLDTDSLSSDYNDSLASDQDNDSSQQPSVQEQQTGQEEEPNKADLYELVELLQDNLQVKCSQCQHFLSDPYQVTCCGANYCYSCLNKLRADRRSCPKCHSESGEFTDKCLRRSLSAVTVGCSNQEEGCTWRGELGQLDDHLNTDPPPDKQLDGCQHEDVKCLYCEETGKRRDIKLHQDEQCAKGPSTCEYCHEYQSHHDDIVYNHWPMCGSHPIHCPNGCGLSFQRQMLNAHITDECSLVAISCDFHQSGCSVKPLRKDMSEHLRESLVSHTSLLAASHARQQSVIVQLSNEIKALKSGIQNLDAENRFLQGNSSRLQSHCNELLAENKSLRQEMNAAIEENVKFKREQSFQSQAIQYELSDILPHMRASRIPSIVLVMSDFQLHKKAGDEWYSPPIYTHHQGYKICLGAYANGHGTAEGSHLTVTLYFMRGSYDRLLKWPFHGTVSFRLLDQVKGDDHKSESIVYDSRVRERVSSRVTVGERAKFGLGLNKFIAHTKLEPKYLLNNTLLFQIRKFQLH